MQHMYCTYCGKKEMIIANKKVQSLSCMCTGTMKHTWFDIRTTKEKRKDVWKAYALIPVWAYQYFVKEQAFRVARRIHGGGTFAYLFPEEGKKHPLLRRLMSRFSRKQAATSVEGIQKRLGRSVSYWPLTLRPPSW